MTNEIEHSGVVALGDGREAEIEVVGRVLAAQYWNRLHAQDSGYAGQKYPDGVEQYVEERWSLYADDARAAIAALARPAQEPVACIGADDPEERCPRHPSECTCWQIDPDHPMMKHTAPQPVINPTHSQVAGTPGLLTDPAPADHVKTCERCQGNGEIVTDWERYRHPHEGDVGDEAVAECPDCNGEGEHQEVLDAIISHNSGEEE